MDDCVLVVPETGRADYIGRVVGFAGKAPNDVQVNWFYRPEEVIGGRKVSSACLIQSASMLVLGGPRLPAVCNTLVGVRNYRKPACQRPHLGL